MTEKITIWCGFCTINYWEKTETGSQTITLTAKGEPYEDPTLAWEEALVLESKQEAHAKEKKVRITSMHTGICPPHFLY